MTVPALLLTVDGQIDLNILRLHPLVDYLLIVNKVVLGARAVNNLELSVIFSVIEAVVDYRTQRSKSDTAGDKEQILTAQFGLDGKTVAVRSADCYLLTGLKHVYPARQTAALLYGELHILAVCRRGGYRKQRLSHAGDREHSALTGHMLKGLFTVGRKNTKGLDVRCIGTYIGNNGYRRDKHFVIHCLQPPFRAPSLPLRYSCVSGSAQDICRSRHSRKRRRCSSENR